MLARISNALIKSVAAVASSVDSGLHRARSEDKPQKNFQKASPEKVQLSPESESQEKNQGFGGKNKARANLKLVPAQKDEAPQHQETSSPDSPYALLQLQSALSESRAELLRMVGTQSYQLILRNQKKTLKKGAIFDSEAG